MHFHYRKQIPITKDNVIFAKIFLMFVCGIFILVGIWGLYENNEEYKNYSKSDDIRQIDAKVTEVTESDVTSYGEKVGKSYNYTLEYFIDNVKYKTKSIEFSYNTKPIEPLKIGDIKKVTVFKDGYGNFQTSKMSYQDLLTQSAKNREVLNKISKKERDKKNRFFIFFMLFAVTVGSFMMWALNASVANSSTNNSDNESNYQV